MTHLVRGGMVQLWKISFLVAEHIVFWVAYSVDTVLCHLKPKVSPLAPNCVTILFFLFLFFPTCSITITTSCFPVPSICFRDPVNDWFESLAQCLHWNVRKKQNYLSSEEDEFWGWLDSMQFTNYIAILTLPDQHRHWITLIDPRSAQTVKHFFVSN